MTALEHLKQALEAGTFHHATYRDRGTLWEGLHIYGKKADGFRGYEHWAIVLKDDPDLEEAFRLVSGTGVSVGAYGEG